MLVVSDATPINLLVRLRLIDLLPTLYGHVVIPTAVHTELSHAHTPSAIREWLTSRPNWLDVRKPADSDSIVASGAGEREAIALALELKADLLLVDDKEARMAARRLNIAITGTLGVLELASVKKLIELPTVVRQMEEHGFFVKKEILAEMLERHLKRGGP